MSVKNIQVRRGRAVNFREGRKLKPAEPAYVEDEKRLYIGNDGDEPATAVLMEHDVGVKIPPATRKINGRSLVEDIVLSWEDFGDKPIYHAETFLLLPSVGNEETLYIVKEPSSLYLWDMNEIRYIPIAVSAEFDIIYGGGPNG